MLKKIILMMKFFGLVFLSKLELGGQRDVQLNVILERKRVLGHSIITEDRVTHYSGKTRSCDPSVFFVWGFDVIVRRGSDPYFRHGT